MTFALESDSRQTSDADEGWRQPRWKQYVHLVVHRRPARVPSRLGVEVLMVLGEAFEEVRLGCPP
jgi:hypothetical protein